MLVHVFTWHGLSHHPTNVGDRRLIATNRNLTPCGDQSLRGQSRLRRDDFPRDYPPHVPVRVGLPRYEPV